MFPRYQGDDSIQNPLSCLCRGSGDVSFIIQALAWFWIAYIHVLRAPYTGFVHPMARSLIAGGLFCAFVAASSQARNQNSPANETLMAVLAPVLGAAAALLTAARLLVARRTASKFASLPRDALVDRKAHFFVDAEELEVLMRSVKPASMDREQDDAEEDGDPLKLALRDTQLARGAFNAVGHSHALHFDNACSTNALAVSQGFLMGNVSGARLTLAKGEAKASFAERIHALQIDAALTEIKGALGGDNLDLTSYVELQRRISAAIKTHRETLEAIRDVWRLGLRSRVGLASIHKMLKRAHLREKLAETQYKALLQAYPTNSQILSAYSQFLRGVRGNISGGAKYLQASGQAGRRRCTQQQKAMKWQTGTKM